MADVLSASAAQIQQTVSIYLIGFAGAQLVVGPLSDRFGRKPVLICCYLLFSAASVICALANQVEWLIIGRFIQSLGGCAGVLISRAIVRDIYSPKDMAKVMSYMITGFSMAPLLAPSIGGFIGVNMGWRSLFYILAGFGVVLVVWTTVGFKESNTNLNPKATQVPQLARNYAALLKNRQFLGYFLVVSSSVAGVLTYTSSSSFVLIEQLNVPAQYYGLLFSISAFGMFSGSLLAARLSTRLGGSSTLNYGCSLLVIAGVVMAVLPWFGWVSVITIVGPMFIYSLGNGIVMPSAMSLAITPFPTKAGAAAALIGCSQSALGALCGYLVSLLYNGTAIPMTSMIGLMSVMAFIGRLMSRNAAQPIQQPKA
jgi:DHA1 family bicyclomycin/chloramphenicol resistance-like MFS transporter